MQSASNATYVSPKIVNAYAKKKQQREQKKAQTEQLNTIKEENENVQIKEDSADENDP